jgi:hypothetical protein
MWASFSPVGDLKDQLAGLPLLRLAVEPQGEGPVEELGQPGGKVGIFRGDPHLRGAEGAAEKQNAVGLRPGAAELVDGQTAQLVFRFKGERHPPPPPL